MKEIVKYNKITEEELKNAVKEVLGSDRPPEPIYENHKPTKEKSKIKWKLARK